MVILFAVLAIIGNVIKDDTDAAATVNVPSTWATRPDPTTSGKPSPAAPAATTAPKFTRTATVTPSPDFPAGLDPRCSQAPADLVEKITAKLKDPGHRVAHAVLLTSATGAPYIGASIVAADGLMVEKSDVWVNTKSRGMTAATAGARRTTDLPTTTDVLDIDLGGDEVQAVDMCAWKWAQASGYN
ncbi:hypothetical protein ACWFRF_20945 [Nocardia sp. NPDC055165]